MAIDRVAGDGHKQVAGPCGAGVVADAADFQVPVGMGRQRFQSGKHL